MRQAFAHQAVLTMAPDSDTRAPGAAITVALCGHWEHEPPCPLAPHHTSVRRHVLSAEVRVGDVLSDEVLVRVVFATEPDAEADVRRRIDLALAHGMLQGPERRSTFWELRSSGRSEVTSGEADHACRLVGS